jgi:hypothetical protein
VPRQKVNVKSQQLHEEPSFAHFQSRYHRVGRKVEGFHGDLDELKTEFPRRLASKFFDESWLNCDDFFD